MNTLNRLIKLTTLMLVAVPPGLAWDLTRGIEAIVPPEEVPSFYEILVVSADSLNPAPHTNKNPPNGVFTVHERIRGHLRQNRIAAYWYRMPSKSDVPPWSDGMPETWKWIYWHRPTNPEWNAIPVPAPEIGQKVIVFGQVNPGDERNMASYALSVEPDLTMLRVRAVYKYTSENVATLRQHMGRTDWPPFVMVPLCLAAFTLAIASVGRLVSSSTKNIVIHSRRLRQGGTLFVASLLSWLLFECGNVTGGIRVDLLFLFPLFMLAAILLVASGTSWRFKKSKQIKECKQGAAPQPPAPTEPSEGAR